MIEATETAIGAVTSPPLAPAGRAIDLVHLSRMTLGDRALEREVLGLFARQMTMLMERIETAQPQVAAAAAHTLKGSATGIGAFAIARAAAELEAGAKSDDSATRSENIATLRTAMCDARSEIAEFLRI